jgi:hypothetical protein
VEELRDKEAVLIVKSREWNDSLVRKLSKTLSEDPSQLHPRYFFTDPPLKQFLTQLGEPQPVRPNTLHKKTPMCAQNAAHERTRLFQEFNVLGEIGSSVSGI